MMKQVVITILPEAIGTGTVRVANVVVRPAQVHVPPAQCFVRNAQWRASRQKGE